METEIKQRIEKIAALINDINNLTTSLSFENFIESRKDKIDVARILQVLALEINSLPYEFISSHFQFSSLEYQLQTNRLVLSDFGLNDVNVWKIITHDVKILEDSVKKLLREK